MQRLLFTTGCRALVCNPVRPSAAQRGPKAWRGGPVRVMGSEVEAAKAA